MRTRTALIVHSAVLALACYLPPVYLFTDALMLPKFYLLLLSVGCGGVMVAVARRQGWGVPAGKECLRTGSVAFVAVSVLECLYVVMLMAMEGMPSRGVCGTFENPAGLALGMCVAIPLAVHLMLTERKRWRQGMWVVALLLMVTVLWFTRSRTGLICLSVFLVVYACTGIHRLVSGKRVRLLLYAVLLAAASVGMAAHVRTHKTDSTSGRAFILMRSWELAMERPFAGHGHGGFGREYMLRQAAFFREHPDSRHAMLADDIRHPLNEFLLLWVEYGVAGPVLLLAVLLLPLRMALKRRREELRVMALPLVAVCLFSCFSYPFHYPVAWVVACTAWMLMPAGIRLGSERTGRVALHAVLLASAALIVLTVNDAVHEHLWYRAYRHSFREEAALEEYGALHGYFCHDPYFLYSYAMASFKRGDLDRAERMIAECGKCRNGYNRELLAGDICLYRKNFAGAAAHYGLANDMCPVRFAPLEGLYKVYDATGDTLRRQEVAARIAQKQVKVRSWDVERIRGRCQ